MPIEKHFDEARQDAVQALVNLANENPKIQKAVLLDDVHGKIRAIVWVPAKSDEAEIRQRVIAQLSEAAGVPFWSGEVWVRFPESKKSDELLFSQAWDEGHLTQNDRVRVSDQVRSRLAWLTPPRQPPWNRESTRIVAFYSFKGGVGRTTALASFAIQRAKSGERVAVVDLDLDAPGAGALLAADTQGTMAPWGAVDYFLEKPQGVARLEDYFHTCNQIPFENGAIYCFPAGQLSPEYLTKVGRLDLEGSNGSLPLDHLLTDVRKELAPNWIVLDARAGLSPAAGLVLSGIAHCYVVFSTTSRQSWSGMRPVLQRIGGDRLRSGHTQADCVLVHAMVPESAAAAEESRARFSEQAEECFVEHYYAEAILEDDAIADDVWSLDDLDSSEAPHVSVPLAYSGRLAAYSPNLAAIADALIKSSDYADLDKRICSRFRAAE